MYIVSTVTKARPSVRKSAASQRVNLRVAPQLKQLLIDAAEMQRIPLSDFMLKAARTAAEVTMADQTRFVLTSAKWREFNAALDEPPRDIPALRRLFTGKSVFQKQ